MAYTKRKRSYRRRKTPSKNARGSNNKQVSIWSDHSVLEKANRALALVNNVRRFINTEVKHYDTSYTAGGLSTSGQVINLCAPSKGDTISARDGISIKPLHLSIKGSFRGNGADTTPNRIRAILFRGKQENGSVPTTTDVLESQSVYSHKNYTDRFRTKVLYDKIFIPTTRANALAEHPTCEFNLEEKLQGHINFSEASDLIEAGGIYLLLLMDSAVNTSYFTMKTRVTFTDN